MTHYLRIRSSEVPDALRKEIASYSPVITKISELAVNGTFKGYAYNNLAEFVDSYGSRLSGSKELEDAIDSLVITLRKEGLENVHKEEVVVPRWERGEESASLISPRKKPMSILGLGGSVGTPPEGITDEVLVVKSFDELTKRSEEAKGKMIVFNQEFVTFPESVLYRLNGAAKAAEVGGVAALIRSVAPFSLNTPHAGWQTYNENLPKIPVASITVEDAEMLGRIQARKDLARLRKDTLEPKIEIALKMGCSNFPMAKSHNIIAELKGSAAPDEVVMLSGHLDGWDVGQGALDAAGAFVSWSALAVLKALGLKPRRTIRAVLFTGEQQGNWGAKGYYTDHREELGNMTIAMESSTGTFQPTGLGFTGSDEATRIMQEVVKLLTPMGATQLASPAVGGSDIEIFAGIPQAILLTKNDKYYWFHNTAGDMMTTYVPEMMDLCTAVWAAAAFVVADLRDPLPRV